MAVDNKLLPRITFRPCLPYGYRPSKPIVKSGPASVKGKEKAEESEAAALSTASYIKRLEGSSLAKAGITRAQDEIAQITYEANKGSKFYDREREKDQLQTEHIQAVLADIEAKVLRKRGNLAQEEADVEHMAMLAERERDLSQVVCCIDADSFYASVEELYDPSLVGKPFVVGGGIVLTWVRYQYV